MDFLRADSGEYYNAIYVDRIEIHAVGGTWGSVVCLRNGQVHPLWTHADSKEHAQSMLDARLRSPWQESTDVVVAELIDMMDQLAHELHRIAPDRLAAICPGYPISRGEEMASHG